MADNFISKIQIGSTEYKIRCDYSDILNTPIIGASNLKLKAQYTAATGTTADSGINIFNANSTSDSTFTITGSAGIKTFRTSNTNTVTIMHDNILSASGTTSPNHTSISNLGYGSSFYVPVISYNKTGHITSVSTASYKLNFTDNKVLQEITLASEDYNILLKYTSNATDETNSVKYAKDFYINPNRRLFNGYNINAENNLFEGNVTLASKYKSIQTAIGASYTVSLNGNTLQRHSIQQSSQGVITVNSGVDLFSFKSTPSTDNKVLTESDISGLVGAMVYKGTTTTISNNVLGTNPTISGNPVQGWTFVASSAVSITSSTRLLGKSLATTGSVEVGDMFVYNGTNWNIISGENQVTNSNPTLNFGASHTLGTIDGTNFTVIMPANPNTDEKVGQLVNTTNGEFPIIVRGTTAGTTATTASVSFGTNITANPSTAIITASGYKTYGRASDEKFILTADGGADEMRKLWDERDITDRIEYQNEYYQFYNGYINSSNEWASTTSNQYSHFRIPLDDIKKIYVKSRSTNSTIIAFLKSYNTPIDGDTPDFATGYNSRIYIPDTDTSIHEYDVPVDAKFLYVYRRNTSVGNYCPIYLAFTGIGITEYKGSGTGFIKDDGTVDTKEYITAEDLSDVQIQADYTQNDETQVDYIKNAPLVRIYRNLIGYAASTSSPYWCARWKEEDTSITEYKDGMVVCVKVPVAGNGSYGTALQINELGYKPIVYNVNSMISTRYASGSVVWAVYNETQKAKLYLGSGQQNVDITGCWQVMDYDSDTTTITNVRHLYWYPFVTTDLLNNTIVFRKNENYVIPIHSASAGTSGTNAYTPTTATNKSLTAESFDPFGEILHYSYASKVNANNKIPAGCLYEQLSSLINIRSIFNIPSTTNLIGSREVYIVASLQDDGMMKLATDVNPWTQTLPTSSDSHYYIMLGRAYDTYRYEMTLHHPIYFHNGTYLQQYTGVKIPSITFRYW